MTDKMDKLSLEDGQSMNIEDENIRQLQQLFPDVFNEGKVDFDALKAALGEHIEDKEERYNFTWHGKNKARQIAQTPSTGTLRPCKEESVDWDSTQNLFIEGDNLEVLKLLQKTYQNKIKLIFIDPPYNTGGEFIYPDRFQDNLSTYLKYTGQVDESGIKFSNNTDSSGRYHSNWLNMMYPRIKLAKQLLTRDGAIFISIDDNECGNLEQIANEIFGKENFVARIVWEKVYTPKSNGRVISTDHDYILVYSKSSDFYEGGWNFLPRSDEQNSRFSNPDSDPKGPWRTYPLDVRTENSQKREKYRYEVTTPSGRKVKPAEGRHWSLPLYKFDEEVASDRIYFGKNGDAMPTKKVYLSEARNGIIARTWWSYKEVGGNQTAKQELIKLFGGDPGFLTPKPVSMLKRIIQLASNKDSIILDFFSGSCSTAEAVINENFEDKGKRRFIVVQLPEPCPESSAAFRSGYLTIAELGKSRIRKVASKMKLSEDYDNHDTGFKVFKLDQTNINQWDANYETLTDALDFGEESIKPERSEHDVLYEILLKYGLDLSYPVQEHTIADKTVFNVAYGSLIVCLADNINMEAIEGIATLVKELDSESTRVVFKDSGFANDAVKVNAMQILKQHGIDEVKSI